MYPPEVGKYGYVGSVTMCRSSETYSCFDPSTMDKEDTVSFPLQTVSRNSNISYTRHAFYWLGKLDNGTYITPGNYSLVSRWSNERPLSADIAWYNAFRLRPFDTPEHSDNWDTWKTPDTTVLPLPSSWGDQLNLPYIERGSVKALRESNFQQLTLPQY